MHWLILFMILSPSHLCFPFLQTSILSVSRTFWNMTKYTMEKKIFNKCTKCTVKGLQRELGWIWPKNLAQWIEMVNTPLNPTPGNSLGKKMSLAPQWPWETALVHLDLPCIIKAGRANKHKQTWHTKPSRAQPKINKVIYFERWRDIIMTTSSGKSDAKNRLWRRGDVKGTGTYMSIKCAQRSTD